jgi:tRNA A-37 threonylcarbamoyl transferase component Bud32
MYNKIYRYTESMNDELQVDYIISENTHYGVIWVGRYKKTPCVVKIVLIDTGIHYDRQYNSYLDNDIDISSRKAMTYFFDDKKPYLQSKYIRRKSMSMRKFNHEVNMIRKMSIKRLAPKLLGSWVNNTSYKIHYGIIIMEQMTCTLKDIILRRDLEKNERNRVLIKINTLHNYGVTHGDLKPSNVGIICDRYDNIKHIRFIDWAKGEYTNNTDLFTRDIRTFKNHIKKNIRDRS